MEVGRTAERGIQKAGRQSRWRRVGATVKSKKGLRDLGRHPERRGVLGGKYEVEVESRNEMSQG